MKSIENTPALLTRPEAAAYLTISLRTLDEKLASGDLPACRFGGAVRIRRSSLDQFIEAAESRLNPKNKKPKSKKGVTAKNS